MFHKLKKVELIYFLKGDKECWNFGVNINNNWLTFYFQIKLHEHISAVDLVDRYMFNQIENVDFDESRIDEFTQSFNFILMLDGIKGKWVTTIKKTLGIESNTDLIQFMIPEFFNSLSFKAVFYNYKFLSLLLKKKVIEF